MKQVEAAEAEPYGTSELTGTAGAVRLGEEVAASTRQGL